MAGPDAGTRPSKKRMIKKGTPSRRGGGLSGLTTKNLKKTAWVQTGGPHRAAWKSIITDPAKAAGKAAGKGAQQAKATIKKNVKSDVKKVKSGWKKFKGAVSGSATSQQWKTRNKKK